MPLAAGPDGAGLVAPYLYWDVRTSAGGQLVRGATFFLEHRKTSWDATANDTTVVDCVAAGCTGPDLDPDPGEFAVMYLAGNDRVSTSVRYRVQQTAAPAGHLIDPDRVEMQDATDWGTATTYSFGTFINASGTPVNAHTITVLTGDLRTSIASGQVGVGNSYTVGARFGLFASATATTPLYQCTVAAASPDRCTFTGVTQTSGRLWVGALAPVAGSTADQKYSAPLTMLTSAVTASNTVTPTDRPYRYATPTLTSSNQTITLPAATNDNTDGAGAIWANSSQRFANRLKNPALAQTCSTGVRVAMVVDLSGSVYSSRNTLYDAAAGFVTALRGTGSSVALFSFSNESPRTGTSNYPQPLLVDDTNDDILLSRLDGYRNAMTDQGGTNWDAGLWAAGNSTYNYDVVLVLTDGNPTRSALPFEGDALTTTFQELERAVLSANVLKNKGSRVLSVGIGAAADISDHNLAAISGPQKYQSGLRLNEVDYVKAEWNQLSPLLTDYAAGLDCTASVTVTKQTVVGTSAATPASGWQFTTTASAGTVTPAQTQTTSSTGQASWQLSFTSTTATTSVVITETQQAGWQVTALSCTVNGVAQTTLPGTSATLAGVGVGDKVACTFTNTQSAPSHTITINKGDIRTSLDSAVINVESKYTEGARFGLFADATSTTALYQCTTTVTGACTFTGVSASGVQLWVGELDPVPGSAADLHYSAPLTTLTTAYTSGSVISADRAYRYATPVLAATSQTITLPGATNDATDGAGDADADRWADSSQRFANRLKNPDVVQTCPAGVKVAMVVDLSGSVYPSRDQLYSAAAGFVTSLKGTGSSVALFSFSNESPRLKNEPDGTAGKTSNFPQPVVVDAAGEATLHARLDNYRDNTLTTGGTNWDAGLWEASIANTTYDYDLVLVLTDGNPTRSGDPKVGDSLTTTFQELERAVFSANKLKDQGSRVVTVGIGAAGDVSDHNLAAISGPQGVETGLALNDVDYVNSDWAALDELLVDYANSLDCSASVTLTKQWVINGQTYQHGSQPAGFDATATLTGPGTAGATVLAWGAVRTGYTEGDKPAIDETVLLEPIVLPGCSVVSREVSVAGTNQALPHAPTLVRGDNTFTVTNTVTCTQLLSLVKSITFGSEPTSSWVLSAAAPSPALPGPMGRYSTATPVTAPVTSGIAYVLGESGGSDLYVPDGTWQCVRTGTTTSVPVTPGADPTVTLGLGQDVTCTIKNTTAQLTLLKHVLDPALSAGDFNLTATPASGYDLSAVSVVGADSSGPGSRFPVRPNHTYTIAEALRPEAGNVAYLNVRVERVTNPQDDPGAWVWIPYEGDSVSIAPSQSVVLRFVNDTPPDIVLPLTGGLASDAFLIGGGGILLLALALGAGQHKRTKRRRL